MDRRYQTLSPTVSPSIRRRRSIQAQATEAIDEDENEILGSVAFLFQTAEVNADIGRRGDASQPGAGYEFLSASAEERNEARSEDKLAAETERYGNEIGISGVSVTAVFEQFELAKELSR